MPGICEGTGMCTLEMSEGADISNGAETNGAETNGAEVCEGTDICEGTETCEGTKTDGAEVCEGIQNSLPIQCAIWSGDSNV